MGDEALPHPTPFLSCMTQRSLTCASSHINVMRPRVISKENLSIQDISIHQKASNLVNSLLPAYATSVNVWDNMASLQ